MLFTELKKFLIFIILSHHYHHASYGRNLENAVDDFDDTFQPFRSVARQRRDTDTMVLAQIDLHQDASQYSPEEIRVEVRNMKIYVKGRHVIEQKNGYDFYEFERVYAVPEGVDSGKISTQYANSTNNIQVLKIQAPKPSYYSLGNPSFTGEEEE